MLVIGTWKAKERPTFKAKVAGFMGKVAFFKNRILGVPGSWSNKKIDPATFIFIFFLRGLKGSNPQEIVHYILLGRIYFMTPVVSKINHKGPFIRMPEKSQPIFHLTNQPTFNFF